MAHKMFDMKPEPSAVTQHRLQITGWCVFIASALGFTASTWKSGDALGLAGSLLFLAACGVFLWPLLQDRRSP